LLIPAFIEVFTSLQGGNYFVSFDLDKKSGQLFSISDYHGSNYYNVEINILFIRAFIKENKKKKNALFFQRLYCTLFHKIIINLKKLSFSNFILPQDLY
jgi:hypothetical protein